MKKLLILSLLLTFTFTISLAQTKKITKEEVLTEWNKLDTFTKKIKYIVPELGFYAALVYDGKIISKKKMGYANRETKVKMNDKTIHLWGSVSKMFTSVAILQLLERGKLKLDDPITKYIPELKEATSKYGGYNQVKIHHLLNHTSGLDWRPLGDTLSARYAQKKQRRLWENIRPNVKYLTLLRKPGKKYAYNNGAYSLLGIVIEKVSNIPFTQYIGSNIFKPLGMKTAHYGKSPRRLAKHLASSYRKKRNDSVITIRIDRTQGIHNANGGVKASIKDMLKFMDFLNLRKRKRFAKVYEKTLKWVTIKKYYHNISLKDTKNKFAIMYKSKEGFTGRAAGFLYSKNFDNGVRLFGHTGHIGEYQSLFMVRTDVPFGILLMYNTSGESGTKDNIALTGFYASFLSLVGRNRIRLSFFDWSKSFKDLKK